MTDDCFHSASAEHAMDEDVEVCEEDEDHDDEDDDDVSPLFLVDHTVLA